MGEGFHAEPIPIGNRDERVERAARFDQCGDAGGRGIVETKSAAKSPTGATPVLPFPLQAPHPPAAALAAHS